MNFAPRGRRASSQARIKRFAMKILPGFLGVFAGLLGCQAAPHQTGPAGPNSHLAPTDQWLRPAGQTAAFPGRPVDLIAAPDGKTIYAKDHRGLVVIDSATWKVRQELKFPEGGSSWHGLAMTKDGKRLFASTSQSIVWEATVSEHLEFRRKYSVPGADGQSISATAGIALSEDESKTFICLSRDNSLAILNLSNGKVLKRIPVGVAPYDVVLSPDSRLAFVSNWGGRHPRTGEKTAPSAGTATLVDDRGIAASGTVSVVDLEAGTELDQIATGLHPCDLELDPARGLLYVANANSDSVSVINIASRKVQETILVAPVEGLGFGSAPNALSLSQDGRTLYVANGGNNAVAVVPVGGTVSSRPSGFIPTAWFPGGIINDGKHLFIANVKGFGSRTPQSGKKGWNSHGHLGTVSKVEIPDSSTLAQYSRQVLKDAGVPRMLKAWERAQSAAKAVPVPAKAGAPSVFEHVVYIIKENRTYDQVLGDLSQGNGDPSLCVFGREVSPNHHALAEEFVLLDNYYCNGVCSADGHAWAMEGYATDYLEKSFGGWTRSYPFSGDDPLSFAPTGFIWDQVLMKGLTFRNFGEMSKSQTRPRSASFKDVWEDYQAKTGKITFEHEISIDALKRYSSPESPGWQLRIPDAIRADVFIKEFAEFEHNGQFPNLTIIFLPSDHTSGTRPGNPTPRAQVADNDLALGRIIERISESRFWPKTCVFVIEDDPQNGFDHVDGHRSLCLIASPYTKRGKIISTFYNQTSVLHTMCRIFGAPAMNQMVALAPVMTDCFTSKPNFTPYRCRPNQVPLDEMNPEKTALNGSALHLAELSLDQNFEEVDRAEEDALNRIIWHAMKGADAPYPAGFAGAHGRGLKRLGLKLDSRAVELDD